MTTNAETAPDDALTRACREIEVEAAHVLEPLAALRFRWEEDRNQLANQLDELRRCRPGSGGAWVLMPRAIDIRQSDAGEAHGVDVPFRPLFVLADGTRVTADVELTMQFHAGVDREQAGGYTESTETFTVKHGLTDYDGDGLSELVLTTEVQGHEHFESHHYIFKASGGKVRPYPALRGVDIEQLEDFDGDGRLDVVSIDTHYPGENCLDMEPIPVGVPPVLYHARDDGTFSATDEVARAFMREQCPSRPRTLVAHDPDRDGPWDMRARQAVACARMRGMSPDEVEAQLRREWKRLPAEARDSSCGTTLADLLGIALQPPLVEL